MELKSVDGRDGGPDGAAMPVNSRPRSKAPELAATASPSPHECSDAGDIHTCMAEPFEGIRNGQPSGFPSLPHNQQ